MRIQISQEVIKSKLNSVSNEKKLSYSKSTEVNIYIKQKGEKIPNDISKLAGKVDQTKYQSDLNETEYYALQRTHNDSLWDVYRIDNFEQNYRITSNNTVSSELSGLPIYKAKKNNYVQMVRLSDLGYSIDDECILESPWGDTQTKDIGVDAFIVIGSNCIFGRNRPRV
ncbi:hypothetical protein L3V83_13665 [Thiotrichales bacterium 19X7-9]|nr:hypothetical protein [Thiotrichales bacterium 19X7-9]